MKAGRTEDVLENLKDWAVARPEAIEYRIADLVEIIAGCLVYVY